MKQEHGSMSLWNDLASVIFCTRAHKYFEMLLKSVQDAEVSKKTDEEEEDVVTH